MPAGRPTTCSTSKASSPRMKPASEADYAAGTAPILYLQPAHDPLAHVEDAHEFKRALGERVTVVVIPRASHAVIAEQPEAVSAALIAYARRLWP